METQKPVGAVTRSYTIFGASLSHQSRNRETGAITGYAEAFDAIPELRPGEFHEVQRITYPGNRLSDAGLVKIHDVIAAAPDVCIVEPLVEDTSRGRAARPDELRSVYGTLLRAGILPVTFLVPLPVDREIHRSAHYAPLMALFKEWQLPFLIADTAAILRAGAGFNAVHTTPESAPLLARQLAEYLASLDIDALRAGLTGKPVSAPIFDITETSLPVQRYRRLVMTITPKDNSATRLRLIQAQRIGQLSPNLTTRVEDLEGNLLETQENPVWDPYCHYDRMSHVTLLAETAPLPGAVRVTVDISSELPDYSRCRRDGIEWPRAHRLGLFSAKPLVAVSDGGVEMRIEQCV